MLVGAGNDAHLPDVFDTWWTDY